MKRPLIVLGVTLALTACRDSGLGTGEVPIDGDAGAQIFPDARVVGRVDAGDPGQMHPAPTLTQLTPASGPETGGTRVTLRGTSFIEPAEVFVNGVPATNVVVLDEVSIAATTPANRPGRALVEVRTVGGVAELPDGFRYHRELKLTDVSPRRIPDEGGVLLRLSGRGFDDLTIVLIDRQPLRGVRVIDAETIEGYSPPLRPGRPEIYVFNADAEARRSDLLVVYGTPEPRALAPGYGPIGGGAAQTVDGDGLTDLVRIEVGGARAADLELRSPTRATFSAPAVAAEGAHDVVVANADAEGRLAGGYVAYDPTRVGIEIVAVTPPRVSAAGGAVVAVVGRGFAPGATVEIGGRAARVDRVESAHAIIAVVPMGLAVGPHEVRVFTGTSSAAKAGAITTFAPISVASIMPNSGPASGGTAVTIRGTGFVPGAEVRIGGVPLADVVVVSATEITARTVAGSHGPQSVEVRSADTRGVLASGFSFTEELAIVRLEPEEGSIAGNTYVTVLGRGFGGPAKVLFDGEEGDRIAVENGSVISVRTKKHATGVVDVEAQTASGNYTFTGGYTFYDPRIITGGAWGGPIEGSVNVGVLDIESGRPIPNFVVQLGTRGNLGYAGITDENGLVTISGPDVRGPWTVSAGANEYEHVTYMDLRSRNLTVLSGRFPQSMNPDDPVSPCPTGVPGPVIRGKVYKFKSSLDPVTRPGWRPVARITYTNRNVFGANPPRPPCQIAFVFTDGGTYEICPQRAGTVSVYAILGDFNEMTQEFIPRKMGIVRQVPVAPETVTEDINIALDIELDKTVDVRLDRPPEQLPGPTTVRVFPYLNLGSEGVIPFPAKVVQGTTTVRLENLPNLAGSQFFYLAGSYTTRPDGSLGAPFSETLHESGEEVARGLDVGPFVSMPEDVSPKIDGVLVDGLFSWRQPGIRPDVTRLYALDVRGVSGCCCMDNNMNGTCEMNEPQQCGGTGVQFIRWSVFGEGGLMSYQMPPMPPGVQAFEPPNGYFWVVEQAVAPRFVYDEFIYNQFSRFFWKSWSIWFSQFVFKEQTP